MSDTNVTNTVELSVEEFNAIKYCANCENPQHCDYAVTYAVKDFDGNLTGQLAECIECQCEDCVG